MTDEVRLFDGESHVDTITRQHARELKAANVLYFINHGKDAKLLRPLGEERTAVEKFAGWKIMREMLNTALNRGRSGQFPIGYEIPYAFEGRLTDAHFMTLADLSRVEKFRRVNLSAHASSL